MFDKFEPFQGLQKQNFAFQPSRYETWVAGKMVDSGRTNAIIYANVVQREGSEKVEVTFNDQSLNNELSQKIFLMNLLQQQIDFNLLLFQQKPMLKMLQ